MGSTELLPCVEVEAGAGPARHAVIWLHGLGADGHDFEPLVPYLRIDPARAVRFVFPHAPKRAVTINMGLIMPAWYDIRDLTLEGDIDETGIADSTEQVRALIARENARGIETSRIVLAGFSQGGAIALHAGLRHPERLAGILALSCYLVCGEALATERSAANQETPIFQAHGTHDSMVPLEAGLAARDRLVELGYTVDWRTYPMAHEVGPQEIQHVGRWLGQTLA
jgi:phospholipase/carboxylesterase